MVLLEQRPITAPMPAEPALALPRLPVRAALSSHGARSASDGPIRLETPGTRRQLDLRLPAPSAHNGLSGFTSASNAEFSRCWGVLNGITLASSSSSPSLERHGPTSCMHKVKGGLRKNAGEMRRAQSTKLLGEIAGLLERKGGKSGGGGASAAASDEERDRRAEAAARSRARALEMERMKAEARETRLRSINATKRVESRLDKLRSDPLARAELEARVDRLRAMRARSARALCRRNFVTENRSSVVLASHSGDALAERRKQASGSDLYSYLTCTTCTHSAELYSYCTIQFCLLKSRATKRRCSSRRSLPLSLSST